MATSTSSASRTRDTSKDRDRGTKCDQSETPRSGLGPEGRGNGEHCTIRYDADFFLTRDDQVFHIIETEYTWAPMGVRVWGNLSALFCCARWWREYPTNGRLLDAVYEENLRWDRVPSCFTVLSTNPNSNMMKIVCFLLADFSFLLHVVYITLHCLPLGLAC